MTPIELEDLRQQIRAWISNFLSVPHPHFAGLPPCPFSQQAWLENRVEVRDFKIDKLEIQLVEVAETWSDRLDVSILACSPDDIDAAVLDRRVRCTNAQLARYDLVALVDYPNHPATTTSHTNTSNGKYALVLVQKASHLRAASDRLADTGYYDRWSEEDLNNIVRWRG
ncbi:hypothetical protein [Baaleninema simplex]|uniref:hypothetical protein n=1 Tax=Baaleninema simplex TaxID=2862350 RepID=UPI00034AEFD8|nr:hypothetical protein [Baaleninema simplex]